MRGEEDLTLLRKHEQTRLKNMHAKARKVTDQKALEDLIFAKVLINIFTSSLRLQLR